MNSIQLTITNGPNQGRFIVGAGQGFVVGRGGTGEFKIVDFRMSREHFCIARENGQWELHDLKSSNGTLLNGTLQREAVLQDGDTIVAGDTSFRVDILSELSGRHHSPRKKSPPANS